MEQNMDKRPVYSTHMSIKFKHVKRSDGREGHYCTGSQEVGNTLWGTEASAFFSHILHELCACFGRFYIITIN